MKFSRKSQEIFINISTCDNSNYGNKNNNQLKDYKSQNEKVLLSEKNNNISNGNFLTEDVSPLNINYILKTNANLSKDIEKYCNKNRF